MLNSRHELRLGSHPQPRNPRRLREHREELHLAEALVEGLRGYTPRWITKPSLFAAARTAGSRQELWPSSRRRYRYSGVTFISFAICSSTMTKMSPSIM
mmetsp:Transcript_14488/g.34934  ORF Transcript_14488/g.34934 Transcript_14488/m.34934 type:complete len:99 (+) Transcript_14488:421-717(+)